MRSIILLGFAVCQLSITSAAYAQDPFRIGLVQSTTGIASEDGHTSLNALTLAAEDLKAGGVSVQLSIEDDQTLPKNAASAFQKLVLTGVDAIIGATWLHTTKAITPLAPSAKTVIFNCSNYPESIDYAAGGGLVFTNAYSLADDVAPFRRFLTKRGIHKVAFLRNISAWADLQIGQYRKVLAEAGVQEVFEFTSANLENNDWATALLRIRPIRPDVIVLFLGKDDVDTVVCRAAELHISIPFFGASHTYDGFQRSQARELYNSLCMTYPLKRLRSNSSFVQRYTARFGKPPQLYADSCYDALFIVVEGLKRAQAEKRPLQDALREVSYTGIVAPYKYSSERSFSAGDSSLVCVKNGVLEIED